MADHKENTNEDKATELIAVYDHAWTSSEDGNFRNIYQEVADVMHPSTNNISTNREKGAVKGREIIDVTGESASIDNAAGLSINLFPPGEKFYNVLMTDPKLNEIPAVKKKLGQITEISHAKRANSNFMRQANKTLRTLATLGTGCMFSDYIKGVGLNYKDYPIGTYTFMINERDFADTMMIEFTFTAKQAFQEWGDEAGKTVLEKMKTDTTHGEEFKFIWIVRPRDLEKQQGDDALSMAWESFKVSRTDKVIVEEGGFDEFPFQVPRWSVTGDEKWGRGIGTRAVGIVNGLQVERANLTDAGELHNNPPKEVLDSFEGEVRVKPGALNYVGEIGTIKAIDRQALGDLAATQAIIDADRVVVKEMFMLPAFDQLEGLKGDRRNELEIQARLSAGLRKLVMPVGNIQVEWLTGLVTRDIKLLERNGEFGEMPPEMDKQDFKVEYVGRLALELQAVQSEGWLRWVGEGIELEERMPGMLDNVDGDGGFRRRGIVLGVSVDDMATIDEVKEKRAIRAQKLLAAQQLEQAKVAGGAYKDATKAPEPGSPAEQIVG